MTVSPTFVPGLLQTARQRGITDEMVLNTVHTGSATWQRDKGTWLYKKAKISVAMSHSGRVVTVMKRRQMVQPETGRLRHESDLR